MINLSEKLNTHASERRGSERRKVQLAFEFQPPRADLNARCMDVSLTGAQLATESSLTPGERLVLVARGVADKLELPVEIVWAIQGKRAGVRFVELNPTSLRWLHCSLRDQGQ
jgi:hypothetical protein